MVQWLGLCASTAGGMGSIPGGETKISQHSQKKKKKKVQYITLFLTNLKIKSLTAAQRMDRKMEVYACKTLTIHMRWDNIP